MTACPRCHQSSFDLIHRGRVYADDCREVVIGMCWSCGIVDVFSPAKPAGHIPENSGGHD